MLFFDDAPALWLIPALPALGALLIFIFSSKMKPSAAAGIGCASVGLSFLWTVACSYSLMKEPDQPAAFHQVSWTWLNAGLTHANFGFYFDRISMAFCFVITFVGFLIHVFSAGYMDHDEGERRYFGYLNLFVASMLVLVTADNAFFMFLGWEGVGACSFLLIGHYYSDPANVVAAQKAFIVTRIGDIFLMLGLLLCSMLAGVNFANLSNFERVNADPNAMILGISAHKLLVIAGLLLLAGAAGKSAQLPLQVWLPDAMAGPTPVSALIHAATMVTAGVYLIARFHLLFVLSPTLMHVVAWVGVLTALYGATCAIVQTDIKRILAYSTISQIGYMILGLGVGAFSLGMFHFFTHGFYKALLFLGAGTIIHSLHNEQNIYNMGGLKDTSLRGTFYAILAGAASLAGIPLITAGFFSKDAVLYAALTTQYGSLPLYALGLATALLTSVYSFRLIFVVFFGKPRKDIHVHAPGNLLTVPLYILAVFALVAGYLNLPASWHIAPTAWEHFFEPVFAENEAHPITESAVQENLLMLLSAIVAVAGAGLAWVLYGPSKAPIPTPAMEIGESKTNTFAPYRPAFANLLYRGWDMDRFYSNFVNGFFNIAAAAAWFDSVVVDKFFEFVAMVVRGFHGLVQLSQNGRLSRYAMVMLFGAVAIVTFLLPFWKR